MSRRPPGRRRHFLTGPALRKRHGRRKTAPRPWNRRQPGAISGLLSCPPSQRNTQEITHRHTRADTTQRASNAGFRTGCSPPDSDDFEAERRHWAATSWPGGRADTANASLFSCGTVLATDARLGTCRADSHPSGVIQIGAFRSQPSATPGWQSSSRADPSSVPAPGRTPGRGLMSGKTPGPKCAPVRTGGVEVAARKSALTPKSDGVGFGGVPTTCPQRTPAPDLGYRPANVSRLGRDFPILTLNTTATALTGPSGNHALHHLACGPR